MINVSNVSTAYQFTFFKSYDNNFKHFSHFSNECSFRQDYDLQIKAAALQLVYIVPIPFFLYYTSLLYYFSMNRFSLPFTAFLLHQSLSLPHRSRSCGNQVKTPSYNPSSIMSYNPLAFIRFIISVCVSISPVLFLSAANRLAVFESLSVHMQDGLTYKAELALKNTKTKTTHRWTMVCNAMRIKDIKALGLKVLCVPRFGPSWLFAPSVKQQSQEDTLVVPPPSGSGLSPWWWAHLSVQSQHWGTHTFRVTNFSMWI